MLVEEDGIAEASLRALISEAKELVRLVQNSFETSREQVSAAELHPLQKSLLPHIERMSSAAEDLFRTAPLELHGDVGRIRFALERLTNFATRQPGSVDGLSASMAGSTENDTQGTRGRLLVVDDNADNRDILLRHLERQGYGVTTAADGRRALELLRTGAFELMLLDVLMPVMDGFGVLEQMKKEPALREMPVVMISALDETKSVVRCIQMGAEDYLMKPFDPVLLSARIGVSLEKKRLRDEERRRTRELQELLDQLRRTQDQLLVQENLASLGALTAGIAHEIRNPLNFINNFASAAQELVGEIQRLIPGELEEVHPLFAQLEQYVEKINEHGKRADRIVRGMLMHSRGKSGEPETVDLKNLISDAINLAYHSLRAQDRTFNTRIETSFDPETGSIRAVPQEINRVFLNILNNAFYAVWERKKREGEAFDPEVAIRTRRLEDAVEIRIGDNGPGIPQELMAKIFNPFFTTKPAGAGTGLGLSLSHEIVVRGHNGTIRAESNPGVNTEFIVTLPAGRE